MGWCPEVTTSIFLFLNLSISWNTEFNSIALNSIPDAHTSTHTYVHTCIVNLAVSTTFHLRLGDLEQELILTTKMPKATVGGLSPSKGYILQIFELTDSGPVLLARREFVSKSSCTQTGVDVGGRPLCSELMVWPCDLGILPVRF